MGDKVRQPSGDIMLSWDALWEYFKSDRCTEEMRTWTLRYMYLPDCLSTADANTQLEIMNNCPDYVRNLPEVQAALKLKSHTTVKSQTSIQQVPMHILIALAKRNGK